jgi:D-alanine-D-alanine ligase
MRIGITYDLCEDYALQGYDEEETVEFDCVETITAIELALSSLGHATDRIGHARALIHRLGQGDRWDLVFNIAEGLHGFGRQALVPALLDSYEMPYTFSDPLTLSMTLHKGMAKHVARDLGIPTPDFEIIRFLTDLEKVALPFPLFVKPIAEGTSKGIGQQSKVRDRSELRSQCEHLLARYRQPALVETSLPGRELTVGILGTGDSSHALGVMEILLQEEAEPEVYSYANKKHYERRVLPPGHGRRERYCHANSARGVDGPGHPGATARYAFRLTKGRRRSSSSGASRAHLRNVGLDTDGPVLC